MSTCYRASFTVVPCRQSTMNHRIGHRVACLSLKASDSMLSTVCLPHVTDVCVYVIALTRTTVSHTCTGLPLTLSAAERLKGFEWPRWELVHHTTPTSYLCCFLHKINLQNLANDSIVKWGIQQVKMDSHSTYTHVFMTLHTCIHP